MTNARSGSVDVLGLIRQALDEFDQVPLAATVRRTVRIANLLNETEAAVRMGLELKAGRGHPSANAEATRRLMSDPSTWGSSDGPAERAVSDYIAERTNEEGKVVSHSLAEIDFWIENQPGTDELSVDQYASNLSTRVIWNQILTRTQHHAFTLLCQWERQLTFAVNQESALDAVSARVDALLSARAPEVVGQFNAAFRRLREAADRNPQIAAAEELSQALASCRRILKAVVDIVQPADPSKPRSDSGHALTDDAYKNRLFEFVKSRISSKSFRTALVQGGETLFERFGAVDALTSKGVHAMVAVEEAEYCALHTYLLAGEILLLQQDAEQGA